MSGDTQHIQSSLFDPGDFRAPDLRAVLDDLGPYATRWSRDLLRCEAASLSRLYADKPERYRVATYVLLTMEASGETDIAAPQLARELGRSPDAIRKTLSRLYADGVLAQHQQREGRRVVRRTIRRGELLDFLRLMAGLCDLWESQP